jgi:hypothetical protein
MATAQNVETNDFTSFLTSAVYAAQDRLLIGTTTPPLYTQAIPYTRVTTQSAMKPSMIWRK